MIKNHKSFFYISIFLICVCFFVSCASAPKNKVSDDGKIERISALPTDSSKGKNYSIFSVINPSILADVEIGSPSSLRKAVSELRKSEENYQENEMILLYVASTIMQTVWTNERFDWEIPVITSDSCYTGAINSANQGFYDTATGNIDFLATLLPSLVVVKVDDVSDFFHDSEKDLLSCVKERPKSVLANYLLGLLYKKNGNLDKAFDYCSQAYQESSDVFNVAYEYCDIMYRQGKLKKIYPVAQSLLSKYPSSPELLNLCARIAFETKNLSSAEEYIGRVLQRNPNDLDALLFRIQILVERKDYIHAASLLDVYSRQDNISKKYLLLRAKIQYDWSKNITAAISTMENALSLYYDDKEILLFAAKLASVSGNTVSGYSSEDLAQEVLAVEPDNEAARQYVVEGFVKSERWTEAYEQSSVLVNKPGVDESFVFLHVKICLATGKFDEAINLITPVYKSSQNDEETVQMYIIVLCETNRKSQALSLINQLLPSAQSKMKSFLLYRRSTLQTSEDAMLSDLRSSLISNPRNSDALFSLYKCYYGKSDYRKAQYYLKQVAALKPNDLEIRELNDELTVRIGNSR